MDLIIFAHFDNKTSHNAAAMKYIIEKLKAKKKQYEVIDLYADKFNPIAHGEDFGNKKDPQVEKYQKMISRADRIFVLFPVWWYNMPAMLKGFIDRVFTAGFAYNFKTDPEKGMYIEQLLKGKTAVIVNTFGGVKEWLEAFGNAPVFVLDKAAFEFTGIMVEKRINWFEARGPIDLPDHIRADLDSIL